VNVNWYVAPVGSEPEENATGAPASDPIWCVAPSRFVQVTVVPAGTVRVAGLNAKFWMVTAFVPVVTAGACVTAGVAGGFDADVQPAERRAEVSTRTNARTGNARDSAGIVAGWHAGSKRFGTGHFSCNEDPVSPDHGLPVPRSR